MSSEAMSWAWGLDGLPPVEKFILVTLADGASFYGFVRPDPDRISRRTGCDPAEVEAAVAGFVGRGILAETPLSKSGHPYRLAYCELPDSEMSPAERKLARAANGGRR